MTAPGIDGALRCELHCGDYLTALAHVDTCSLVLADPPYSADTHDGQSDLRGGFAYRAWTPDDVREFVRFWAPRCTGWICAMTDDALAPHYRAAYREAGRADFAAVPLLAHTPRLCGDGPGSGAVYLMVSRPREKRFLGWGSLPCWYHYTRTVSPVGVLGAKPLGLCRQLVRDYSRPGDLVVDCCAGGATTLLAARMEGRHAIGAEMDPITHAKALARLAHMPTERAGQLPIFGGEP